MGKNSTRNKYTKEWRSQGTDESPFRMIGIGIKIEIVTQELKFFKKWSGMARRLEGKGHRLSGGIDGTHILWGTGLISFISFPSLSSGKRWRNGMQSLMENQKVANLILHLLTSQCQVHEVTDIWTNFKKWIVVKTKRGKIVSI